MRHSEQAVLFIGSINILLLLIALTDETFLDIGSIFLLFIHLVIITGALPILLRAIFGRHTISKQFTIIFILIACLSSLLILFSGNITPTSEDDIYFIVLGIIELIPILFLYIKRKHIIWQPQATLPFELD